MKSMVLVLVIVALVAGVAAAGSRAQSLPAVSPAFRVCQPGGETAQCQPLVRSAPMGLEADGDTGGFDDFGGFTADGGDARDTHWVDLAFRVAVAVANAVADWWASHYRGGIVVGSVPVDWALFDPVD